MRGKAPSACATRTFSRAAPKFRPHLKFSQCAQEASLPSPQPSLRSNSAMSISQRYWAALSCPARAVICASSSSSGRGEGELGVDPSIGIS